MRALLVFIVTAALLLVLIGALGGVGTVELSLVVVVATTIAWLWVRRARRRGSLARPT
jgi:hypothetical protein